MIYLIRHASAVPPGGGPDELRPLTESGIREATMAGRALSKLEAPIARILSSPYLRARETARLISEHMASRPTVELHGRLASGASPTELLAVIRAESRGQSVAVVGHNPEIGILSSLLVAMVPGGTVSFQPGSICCVELDPIKDAGRLVWFRRPEDLSAFAAQA